MTRRFSCRVVPFIIFINVGIFVLWSASGDSEVDSQFMADNFLVSWNGLISGRYWTLISSAFSHNMFWHFLLNMFVLNSFGRVIERALGAKHFLKFYFSAAVISSLGHAVVSAFFLQQPDIPALGASGAISGIILLFSLIFPREKILIFGLIPMPAIWGALAFVGLDVWGLIAQAQGGGLPIGHGAHLGGAITGIIYYVWRIRGRGRPYDAS